MRKKIFGCFLMAIAVIIAFAASWGLPGLLTILFHDDFNDNYFDPAVWTAYARGGLDPYAWLKEQNQRLEFNIPRTGNNEWVTVESIQAFSGEGVFETEFLNGYTYNYLYKGFHLKGMYEGKEYRTGIRFADYGPITLGAVISKDGIIEQSESYFLYPGFEPKGWNWLFTLQLKRNPDGTITGIVSDEHGHYFELTTGLSIPHEVPLKIFFNVELWMYGTPTLVWFDNVKFTSPVIEASVDIKPGSCPNPVNLRSKGVLPAAILGSESLNVFDIDPATTLISRDGYEGIAPLRWNYKDVSTPYEGQDCGCHDINGDGYLDLVLKFNTQEVVTTLELNLFESGEYIPMILSGHLKEELGGTMIRGSDCIKILKPGK